MHPALSVQTETSLDLGCWHKAHMAEQTRPLNYHSCRNSFASCWWDSGSVLLAEKCKQDFWGAGFLVDTQTGVFILTLVSQVFAELQQ